ncbi:MAG: hypothetical protein DM484_12805 [Candidatus Methylumidiphilus alinenensis]|uniref:Uncharacterized protein n=1 Tax=Candidatus Methylumidiphilus alinenensis TaxID=2202197 RepID=A0A2W4T153_9GAMM|nr:MAG: hypothetical protein DM484_12805 [Candidatus Methylumidiphilus alinenensis]
MCLSGCTPQQSSSASGAAASGSSASATSPTQPCPSCGISSSSGTVSASDSVVQVSHGVTVKQGSTTLSPDAIQITTTCPNNPHVLQFINREILDSSGKPIARQMRTTGGSYQTTTDPANPVWNTDSAAKPVPYYEAVGAACNCPGKLTTWDAPTVSPGSGETWRANFRAFIICDGKVVREVQWSRSQTDGSSPSYTSSILNTSSLPDWATQTLSSQGYTYP